MTRQETTPPKKMISPKRPLRWLIVGHGRVGRCHAAALNLIENAELCGLVTRDQAEAEAPTPMFTSLADALATTKPDAVIIAAPHHTHRELALEALQAGAAVLCEKPAGCSANDAQALITAAQRFARPLGVVLNQRANPHCLWLQNQIATGQLHCLNINIHGALGRLQGWNAEPELSGGGLLRTVGIHYLDLLRFFFGEPVSISGHLTDSTTRRPGVDDALALTLHHRDQQRTVLATLTLSAVAERGAGAVIIEIEALQGRLRMRGHEIESATGVGSVPSAEPVPAGLFFGPGHLGILREATESLLAGDDFPLSLSAHLPLLQRIDQLYRECWR